MVGETVCSWLATDSHSRPGMPAHDISQDSCFVECVGEKKRQERGDEERRESKERNNMITLGLNQVYFGKKVILFP